MDLPACPRTSEFSRAGPPQANQQGMSPALEIQHVSTAEDAKHYCTYGYCPVECSFGDRSVVDDLQMDHHGEHARLEPVSIRAYRDYAGERSLDQRFVVTGGADADATFALAALAGFFPHPRLQIEQTSPTQIRITRNQAWSASNPDVGRIIGIAKTIARADVDPFADRWEETDPGVLLLHYKQRMQGQPHDAEAFRVGAELWRDLIQTPPRRLLESVVANERDRMQRARVADTRILHPQIAFVECQVWGWDVWYAEIAPVIVAYQSDVGRCSVGCRSEELARKLFGSRGLLEVAEKMGSPGWGGRPAIIGSPRSLLMSRDDALTAASKGVTSIRV